MRKHRKIMTSYTYTHARTRCGSDDKIVKLQTVKKRNWGKYLKRESKRCKRSVEKGCKGKQNAATKTTNNDSKTVVNLYTKCTRGWSYFVRIYVRFGFLFSLFSAALNCSICCCALLTQFCLCLTWCRYYFLVDILVLLFLFLSFQFIFKFYLRFAFFFHSLLSQLSFRSHSAYTFVHEIVFLRLFTMFSWKLFLLLLQSAIYQIFTLAIIQWKSYLLHDIFYVCMW